MVLQTLVDASVPVLGLAIDIDGNGDTGASSLPGWADSASLGIDLLFVLRNQQVSVLAWENKDWRLVETLNLKVDLDENTLDFIVPASLAKPEGEWLVYAVSGVNVDGKF
jgi:hypothetical protein